MKLLSVFLAALFFCCLALPQTTLGAKKHGKGKLESVDSRQESRGPAKASLKYSEDDRCYNLFINNTLISEIDEHGCWEYAIFNYKITFPEKTILLMATDGTGTSNCFGTYLITLYGNSHYKISKPLSLGNLKQITPDGDGFRIDFTANWCDKRKSFTVLSDRTVENNVMIDMNEIIEAAYEYYVDTVKSHHPDCYLAHNIFIKEMRYFMNVGIDRDWLEGLIQEDCMRNRTISFEEFMKRVKLKTP